MSDLNELKESLDKLDKAFWTLLLGVISGVILMMLGVKVDVNALILIGMIALIWIIPISYYLYIKSLR